MTFLAYLPENNASLWITADEGNDNQLFAICRHSLTSCLEETELMSLMISFELLFQPFEVRLSWLEKHML